MSTSTNTIILVNLDPRKKIRINDIVPFLELEPNETKILTGEYSVAEINASQQINDLRTCTPPKLSVSFGKLEGDPVGLRRQSKDSTALTFSGAETLRTDEVNYSGYPVKTVYLMPIGTNISYNIEVSFDSGVTYNSLLSADGTATAGEFKSVLIVLPLELVKVKVISAGAGSCEVVQILQA